MLARADKHELILYRFYDFTEHFSARINRQRAVSDPTTK
jgi:hypothetical protein